MSSALRSPVRPELASPAASKDEPARLDHERRAAIALRQAQGERWGGGLGQRDTALATPDKQVWHWHASSPHCAIALQEPAASFDRVALKIAPAGQITSTMTSTSAWSIGLAEGGRSLRIAHDLPVTPAPAYALTSPDLTTKKIAQTRGEVGCHLCRSKGWLAQILAARAVAFFLQSPIARGRGQGSPPGKAWFGRQVMAYFAGIASAGKL